MHDQKQQHVWPVRTESGYHLAHPLHTWPTAPAMRCANVCCLYVPSRTQKHTPPAGCSASLHLISEFSRRPVDGRRPECTFTNCSFVKHWQEGSGQGNARVNQADPHTAWLQRTLCFSLSTHHLAIQPTVEWPQLTCAQLCHNVECLVVLIHPPQLAHERVP